MRSLSHSRELQLTLGKVTARQWSSGLILYTLFHAVCDPLDGQLHGGEETSQVLQVLRLAGFTESQVAELVVAGRFTASLGGVNRDRGIVRTVEEANMFY